MNEDQFISHLKGLNLDQNISKFEKKIKNGMAELINMTNQIKIENFLSGDLSDQLVIDYVDVINSIKRVPTRIYNQFTGMNSSIILDWILIILQNPEAFARVVVKYFRNYNKNLSYFSAITFPGLFHHFFTEDFQKLSYLFLISMLESGDIGTFWYFCLSFIESSSNFSIVLWSNFLNLNEKQDIFFINSSFAQQNYYQDQSNSQPKIQKSQIFFRFLKCLEIASSALSIYQQQIVKKFYDANAPTCAFFVCKYFIERSFFWFRGNEPDQKPQSSLEKHTPSPSSSDRSGGTNPFFSNDSLSIQNESDSTFNDTLYQNNISNMKNAHYIRCLNEEIIKILEYAALNPKSPQFTAIINVLTSSRYSRYVPSMASSHTNFILSQRDCYLIQEIIKKDAQDKESEIKEQQIQKQDDDQGSPKEKDLKNISEINSDLHEIKFVKVFPLTKDSFNNYSPMSIEIPLSNFNKIYNNQKIFNSNSKQEDFSMFPFKNEKLQKLLDLVMFDRFIENEYSKRVYEQKRSHFCFSSKLLQKNQFIKRKMIDFNSFYGYFQSHNYKVKRHTHSNQDRLNENKKRKGISSYKSYYSQKTENLFDLPKFSPLSPEPAASKCPLSFSNNNNNDSSESHDFVQDKKNKRKVIFNQNSDDSFNSIMYKSAPNSGNHDKRRSLNIHRSYSAILHDETNDFGYNNEEYVVRIEPSQNRKKRTISQIENSYQYIGNLNTENTLNSIHIINSDIHNDENNAQIENDGFDKNDQNNENENEKMSKKKRKKKEKEKRRQEKKEKKRIKKEKSKKEKRLIEKNKEEDKEEKREEKILLKENVKKEKKLKKKLLKQKKEEDKKRKKNLKKEKRREKMRKNIEKKLRKNSELSLSVDFDDGENDSNDSSKNRVENQDKADDDYSSNYSSNLSLNYNDQKSYPNDISTDSNNNNDDNDDTKIENKDTNSKNSELKKAKNQKKKKNHYIHSESDIYTYFSSSILLSSPHVKESHPILHSLIPQIENNESKLILYCIKLNDFEFKSRKIDQITAQYVLLFNSQRLRKIRKYLTCHPNWFNAANFLASKIDFMNDFNIGTGIIIFCQISKFFSPLSSYSQNVLNEILPPVLSSNIETENAINSKSNNQKISYNQKSSQNNIIKEDEVDSGNYNEGGTSSEDSTSFKAMTISNNNSNLICSDTDTSLNIYSYEGYTEYDNESQDTNDNTNSRSQSDNSNKLPSVLNIIKDSNDNKNSIFPPALISKDVVKFLRLVLMLSRTDCFIKYFIWITKALVIFPQIKIIICQIYGLDVSHLEMAFKTLLSKIDEPLFMEIGKEVFKKIRER